MRREFRLGDPASTLTLECSDYKPELDKLIAERVCTLPSLCAS